MDNFDVPLRLRHTKHYAVFQDQETFGLIKTHLQGVYQTARQAFITLKTLRLDAYDGYLYPTATMQSSFTKMESVCCTRLMAPTLVGVTGSCAPESPC